MKKAIAWFLPPKEDGSNPLVSPILAANLAGLPPALIIAAEYDVLSAEDEQYAKRLSGAGVEVQFKLLRAVPTALHTVSPRNQFLRKYISCARTEALL